MTTTEAAQTAADALRDRSIRLFKFLYDVEKFRASRIRNLTGYGNTTPPGAVLWMGGLPNEPELRTVLHGTLAHDSGTILEVDRTELPASPAVPSVLADSVENPESTDRDAPPIFRPDPQSGEKTGQAREAFQGWLTQWRSWAEEVNRVRPVRHLYRRMFRLYEQIDQHPEDFEAVIAAGCLSWHPENHPGVQRHLTVMPAEVMFDAESGLITLQLTPTRDCVLELDMLDPKKHPRHTLVEDVEEQLTHLVTSVLDPDAVTGALRTITHGLSDDAVYDPDGLKPQTVTPRAHVAFAPAFIVRKRTNERKLRVLEHIIAALEDEQQPVPDGVASIVAAIDPEAGEAQLDPDTDFDANAESYLPLAANRAQQEIVWSVENRRHTVVQGPPGTGKTHTIANVLSHLLATGRRVLITAHTERALKEVRGKLPESLQDLVIAVTGQSRDEKAALERSVREMTSFVDSYKPAREHGRIDELEAGLNDLRQEQARTRTKLVQARVNDVETTTIGVYHGTPAQIAQQLADHAHLYGWLADSEPPQEAPLGEAKCDRLLELLRRSDFDERSDELDQPLPILDELQTPGELSDLVQAAQQAEARASAAKAHQQHPAHPMLAALEGDRRRHFGQELRVVADDVRVLKARPEPWIEELLRHLAAGKTGVWEQRARDLEASVARFAELLEKVGMSTVRVPEDLDLDRLLAQAEGLRDHLADGGSVRKFFNAKGVRQASELLGHVVVDGAAPEDLPRLEIFIAHTKLARELDRADKLWPESMEIPPEDTFSERSAWHRAELDVLVRALKTGKRLTDLHRELTDARVPHPDWTDPHAISVLSGVAEEPDLQQATQDAQRPLNDLAASLSAGRSGQVRRRLRDAVGQRDVTAYRQTHQLIEQLRGLRVERAERDCLLDKLGNALPATAEQLRRDPGGASWGQRLQHLGGACAWGWARQELRRRLDRDHTDELMRQLDDVTNRLRRQVLDLTVARAWSHAVDRLDALQRRRLNTYALLAKKLPKGGKYRARKLREVQDALRRCRDAVPAWIMPISYVADVLDVDPNAFDVVIVDEASQAGMDATFLQYLAPKMIVIGDDLQVSPTSFVPRDELNRLADDLLPDFEDKPLWADPETSLFDHASNRFQKRITLVEHFRCMPEIIRFSQRFVYEANGVNLVPLRQYGAQRLTPIRTHHVREGYRTGKLNPPEVEAVGELVAKCAVDPAYEVHERDGTVRKRSFGVISLTGSDQAKQIDQALVERLGEQEYAERHIRCGDAADFQGSQREVIFLSLVEAPPEENGARIPKRGDKATDQRINVAASRAQDQMWLIHSILPEQLHPEDMRFKLLAYCLRTERQFGSQQHAVPERADEHVLDAERFDSLFEQHVFNRIVDRGYAVQTQVPVSGYRIDLVVMGAESQVAVECDGDEFHGPDRYTADVARQRDLERAGWTFFRVRGSKFYADRHAALEPLWELLDCHGIYPVTHEPATTALERVDLPVTPESGTPVPEGQAGKSLADAQPAPSLVPPTLDASPPPPFVQPRVVSDDNHGGESARPPFEHQHHAQVQQLWEQQRQLNLDEENQSSESSAESEAVPATGRAEQRPSPSVAEAVSQEEEGPATEPADKPDPVGPVDELADLAAVYRSPEPYRHWDTSTRLAEPNIARPSERREALRRITEVEGPVLGERLYHLYVRSAGGSKVGSSIRRKLNNSTFQMERDGVLVADDPLGQGGQIPKTFRLPDQPPFVLRDLGERTIHEVPPLELAARIRALRRPGERVESTFRRVLNEYGLTMLTSKTRQRLEECVKLLHDDDTG